MLFEQKDRVDADRDCELLSEEKVAFWDPQTWPPNSPDMNPMYGISTKSIK
uniref:Uncharacterized protein n=1 Tax=Lepeophtheirus salmonis TaxID=72036 RepID=A0A0K2TMT6_LEPSM